MRLSVQLRLKPTPEQSKALWQTLRRANEAANYVSKEAWESQTFGQFKLHKRVYANLRSKFGLPAQMAIRVIAKVADAYKFDKRVKRTFKTYGALAFDARNFSLFVDKGLVSLSTIQGRVKVSFVCGERQRELLQHQFGEADLCYVGKKWYLHVTINVEEPPPEAVPGVLGVDLGIVNLATDSEGESLTGEHVQNARQRYSRLRQDLQRCGTDSAKRHLKRLSGKERNFLRTVNHTISKSIVQKAQGTSRMLALEDLSGIRQATVRKAQRYLHNSWSFGQLRNFLRYKAALRGIPVVLVDPRHTSQACPACGHIARANRKNRDLFVCSACGNAGPTDHIAAQNIARRAAVNRPIVGDYSQLHSLPASSPF
jgi:IS605 OrfB family transposase